LIAADLSPLKPGLAATAAARMVLREIDRLAKARADFAFESTLSGLTYVRRLETGEKRDIVLKSCSCGSSPPNWRCGAWQRVCGRVGITCLGKMSYGGTPGGGRTFNLSIGPWRTLGLSMRTQVNRHTYWSGSLEDYDAKKKA